MPRPTSVTRWLAAASLALACGSAALAQDKPATPQQSGGPVTEAPATGTPAPAAAPQGIQGQNIFTVKPDASADPNYLKQDNGQRAKVQPGNNAPFWRQVGSGTEGYS